MELAAIYRSASIKSTRNCTLRRENGFPSVSLVMFYSTITHVKTVFTYTSMRDNTITTLMITHRKLYFNNSK